MSADLAVNVATLEAKLEALDESIDQRISLKSAEVTSQLAGVDSETRSDISHLKGQVSVLIASGVFTFVIAGGGLLWLLNRSAEVQSALASVKANVEVLLTETGKKVSQLGDAELKRITEVLAQEKSNLEAIRKSNEERAQQLQNQSPAASGTIASRSRLECITKATQSPLVRFASATAALDPKESEAGYQVISGGCSVSPAGQDGAPHNNPIIRSTPEVAGKGWACAAGDPPNIPAPTKVTAYLVACRLSAT